MPILKLMDILSELLWINNRSFQLKREYLAHHDHDEKAVDEVDQQIEVLNSQNIALDSLDYLHR